MSLRRMLALSAIGLLLLAVACTGNAETGLDTADTASALGGQLTLQQASTVVGNYFATNGSYTGFTAAQGKSFEPSIKWVDGGPATDGVVSVRGVTPTSIVLVTAESGVTVGGGAVLCLGQTSGTDSMGSQDATNAAACTGGW